MERHDLTQKEYNELHKAASNKKAIKEMLEELKKQLAAEIMAEDRWWSKMQKKHELDTEGTMYLIDHVNKQIVGAPKPNKQQPTIAAVPQQQAQQGINVRERKPEVNKLFSPSELAAIKKQQEEINNV